MIKANDCEFIRALDVNGDSVSVLKSDLLFETLTYKQIVNTSFNEIYENGFYINLNTAIDYPGGNPYGMLIVLSYDWVMVVQIYINTGNQFYYRTFASGTWSIWKLVSIS